MIDELPVQFQNRDFEFSMSLSPGEEKHYEHHLRPLSRGEYVFGKLNVFLSTRLGLLERRLKFDLAQNVAVYPSIIQMKQFELRAMQHIAHETGIKKMFGFAKFDVNPICRILQRGKYHADLRI